MNQYSTLVAINPLDMPTTREHTLAYSRQNPPSDDEDDPYASPPEEKEGEREDLTTISDLDFLCRHSQAGDTDVVGLHRQTCAAARTIAVNFARVTLTNIKVTSVSDAVLAQHNHDLDPNTVAEAMRRHDWPKWKEAMDAELASFYTLEVWEYAKLPLNANLIKCKWIVARKYDAYGMLKKYKARLVAKGFSQ